MTLSIEATYTNKVSMTLTDSRSPLASTYSDSKNLSKAYTYGSGNNQVNNGVSVTGQMVAGGSTQIDLQALVKTQFGATTNISFQNVKHISVYNQDTTEGSDLVIAATGTSAWTNLFNGGSGNLMIKPYSSFSYNDPFTGVAVGASQRYLHLIDQGSGVNYKILVLGIET